MLTHIRTILGIIALMASLRSFSLENPGVSHYIKLHKAPPTFSTLLKAKDKFKLQTGLGDDFVDRSRERLESFCVVERKKEDRAHWKKADYSKKCCELLCARNNMANNEKNYLFPVGPSDIGAQALNFFVPKFSFAQIVSCGCTGVFDINYARYVNEEDL